MEWFLTDQIKKKEERKKVSMTHQRHENQFKSKNEQNHNQHYIKSKV